MPGVPDLAVRQLALDPDLEELLFEQIAHANGQLGDGEDMTGTRGWGLGASRLRRWRLVLKR